MAVFIKDGKVLLEKRKKTEDNYAGMWAFPGGHKEKSESIHQTLRREMKEEMKISVKKFKPLGIIKDRDPTSKEMFHHHAFLCQKWAHNIKYTREQEKIKWWELKKFKKIPYHRKIDEKVLKKIKVI